MTVQSAVMSGRRAAIARMKSTATVRRITSRTVQNETTGRKVPVWEDVYTGPFRLGGANQGSSGQRTENVGGIEIQVATRVGHFPYTVDELKDSDLIEITAGENAGVVLRIIEAAWQDQATARRVPVVSVTRPAEWA